jgi:hypothetical protein
MANEKKLEDLCGDALQDAIDREKNVDTLIEFVTSHHCKEAEEYYENLTKGRDLVYMPVPGHRDEEIALPIDASPDEYLKEWDRRVEKWVGMKKQAVDRLLALNIDAAAVLLEHFCGLDVDFYLRENLVSKRTAYYNVVLRDIKKFAVDKLGLSRNPIVRLLQEKKIQHYIGERRVHHRRLADYQYYRRVRNMLKLAKK